MKKPQAIIEGETVSHEEAARSFRGKSTASTVTSVIFLVLGICLLIWAEHITTTISILIGIVLATYALYQFVDYGKSVGDGKSPAKIIAGLALLGGSYFMITRTDTVKEIVSFVIGAYIFLFGLLRLYHAFQLGAKLQNKLLVTKLLALLNIACGIACIAGRIFLPDLIIQTVGVIMIISSVADLYGATYLR